MASFDPTANGGGEGPSVVTETLSSRNIRVAAVGNVDAGKSTMIGRLTSSLLDDGRGSSRTSIMKHRHEIENGRTSTASSHLMGFRSSTGEAIAGRDSLRTNRKKSEDEVAKESQVWMIADCQCCCGFLFWRSSRWHFDSRRAINIGFVCVEMYNRLCRQYSDLSIRRWAGGAQLGAQSAQLGAKTSSE